MAEKIKKELVCSVCLEIYTEPKILQCFHVYCQKCLVKLVFRDQEGKLALPCPICRQITILPANTTASLPSAFHIRGLIEILNEHESDFESCKQQPPAIYCSEHDMKEVELFCETCEELVCLKCVIQGGKHHSHDCKDIAESIEIYKEQLAPLLRQLQNKIAVITKTLLQLDENCDEIIQQQGAIKANIRDCSNNLIEIINQRQNQLLERVDKITKEKLDNLAAQKDSIEIFQSQLSSCVDFTKESLEAKPHQHEMLVMKKDILRQATELVTSFQPDTIILCAEADAVFSASADSVAACNKLGRVYTPNSLYLSNCIAMGEGVEEAAVNQKVFAKLQLANWKGEPCSEICESDSIEVKLVSNLTGRVIHGHTEQINGQLVVSYTPVVKGRHKLFIKIDGEHIRGSPFKILVKQPIAKLGTPVKTFSGSLQGPTAVAINRKGEMIVTDRHTHSVTMFTQHGRRFRSFGTPGSNEGQFKEPFGVAVNNNESMIVSDLSNHRIQMFSSDGIFLKAVGRHGNGRLEFNQPHGISYSASNDKLYVCDSLNHRIQVLNSDLTFCKTFGKEGTKKGQFKRPIGITTDSTGQVYVADYYSHRIQVFTSEGQFLRMLGKEVGTGRALDLPFGVAVDENVFVYVSEFYTHCVSVFSQEGAFITSFGSRGKNSGQLIYPYGIAVHDGGVLCVCDYGNHRIQVF